MRFSSPVASLLLLLLAGTARAESEEEKPEPSKDRAPTEEMTVIGDSEVARRRQAVINNLRVLGYREHRRKDGRSMFRPDIPWKPSVLMDDDAYIVLRRTPVRIDPPGKKDNKLRYLWCLPPMTISAACIRVGGQVISKRKLAHAKEEVARATRYEIRMWREAVISRAMEKRVNTQVPDLLDDIWERGQPDGPEGPLLADVTERRAAILQLWSSRSCTPEGAMVRKVIADFVRYEIQASSSPVTIAEMTSINAANRCGDSLLPSDPGRLDGPRNPE
jgi:hypothetical protein